MTDRYFTHSLKDLLHMLMYYYTFSTFSAFGIVHMYNFLFSLFTDSCYYYFLLFCQAPAAAVQGSRTFHFSIYGKKKNAKVSDDVSFLCSFMQININVLGIIIVYMLAVWVFSLAVS